jgi:hypothetical protein
MAIKDREKAPSLRNNCLDIQLFTSLNGNFLKNEAINTNYCIQKLIGNVSVHI